MAVRKAERSKSKELKTTSRGPVDAPEKRHRKPQANEPLDKRLGERRGKQMGQKSIKNRPRGR
jgi:hypothetical protein